MKKYNDTVIVATELPFKYGRRLYKIGPCGIRNDKAYAAVKPHNAKLVKELKSRIQRDGNYTVYLDSGFVRFPDDN